MTDTTEALEALRNAEGRYSVVKIERDRYSEAAERFKRERDEARVALTEANRKIEAARAMYDRDDDVAIDDEMYAILSADPKP